MTSVSTALNATTYLRPFAVALDTPETSVTNWSGIAFFNI